MNEIQKPQATKNEKAKQNASIYSQTHHAKQKAQDERSKTFYKSQHHTENQESNFHDDLTVHGAELHIEQPNMQQARQKNTEGFTPSYNAAGGRQAKAIINTLKQPNASRYF